MIWITTKAWPWLKRNWKWVLFPIGLIPLFIGGAAVGKIIREYSEPPEDLDEKTREVLKKLRTEELEHDRQIADLEVQHKVRLQNLSKEQRVELKELEGKPLVEVVLWFDNL